MHVTLTVKHARRDDALEDLFEREKERIVKRLARVPLELVSLHCEIDLNPHLKEGYASLTLNLPAGKLNARGVGRNVLAALRDAVDDLLVELDRSRKKQQRERRSQRGFGANGNGAESLDELLARIEAQEPADQSRVIRKTLAELYPFVRRELSRHSEVLDRPECNAIDVADVVEESVLRALSSRDRKPDDVPFDRWLFTCAYEVILNEEQSLAERSGSVSLEDDVTPRPPNEGPTTGEEIYLDQVPRTRFFADVLPDGHERTPDAQLDGRNLQELVLQTIRQLPDGSRQILSMVAFDGIGESEAARRLHCSEEEIRTTMADARCAVRAELSAHGFDAEQ